MQQLTVLQPPTAPPAPESRDQRLQEPTGEFHRRVLILEDEPVFREILVDFLSNTGFSVVAVQSGVDGIREALESDFDVILCDMMMPMLPGNLFFRTLKRMRPHLCERFIFMTGHRDNPRISDFVQTVGRPVLAKPFHCDDLLEMIGFVQISTTIGAAA